MDHLKSNMEQEKLSNYELNEEDTLNDELKCNVRKLTTDDTGSEGSNSKKQKVDVTLRELKNSDKNMDLLCNKNPHPLDARIAFKEEGHLYWIDGINENTISATTIIKKFFEPYDRERSLRYVFNSKRYENDTSYKYYKMSKEDILAMWAANGAECAGRGSYCHLQLELYYNKLPFDDTIAEMDMFWDFEKSLNPNWEPFRTEMLVFHELLRVTGSIDMLYRDKKDGKLIIVDWKFSKAIKKNKSNGVGIGKLKHIYGSNFYTYSLQLNLYKRILEEYYGFKVKQMMLVQMHHTKKKYKVHDVEDYSNEISYILNERKKELLYLNILKSKELESYDPYKVVQE